MTVTFGFKAEYNYRSVCLPHGVPVQDTSASEVETDIFNDS
jgi:hypothetical protein